MNCSKLCLQRILLCTLSLSLSACLQTRAELEAEKQQQNLQSSLQQSIGEQAQSIEEMQQHISKIQGHLEEIDHSRKQDTSTAVSGQETLTKRLVDLETRVEALQQKQDLLFNQVLKLQQEPADTSVEKPQTAASYEAGTKAYKAHRYAEAINLLSEFIKQKPRAKHILDANYLLGESYYKQKNYTQAILAYSVVKEKSTKTPLGRKSVLRIAESFHALGNKKDAKAFAQLLQETPDSAEAKLARKFLK